MKYLLIKDILAPRSKGKKNAGKVAFKAGLVFESHEVLSVDVKVGDPKYFEIVGAKKEVKKEKKVEKKKPIIKLVKKAVKKKK